MKTKAPKNSKPANRITPENARLYVGGVTKTWQFSAFDHLDKPLRLIADANGVQVFCDDTGQFVLDRAVSWSIPLSRKKKNGGKSGDYSVHRQRQIVSREFAFQVLLSAAIPSEFADLLRANSFSPTKKTR